MLLLLMLGSTYFLQARPFIPGETYDAVRFSSPPVKRSAGSTSPVQAKFGWTNFTSCLPVTIQFMDSTIDNGARIVGWHWDFGDGTTGTDEEPLHDYLVNGNYTVSFTVFDDTGDSSTATGIVVINTASLVVNLGPDTTICIGSPIILDAGAQDPDVFYIWSNDSTTRTIQVATAGDYWVQIYNATCNAYAEIHVGTRTQLQVDFANSQAGNCLPVSMQFTDNSAACGVGVIYRRWNFDNGDSSLLQNPVHDYQTGGAHTVSLTERDNTGLEVTTTKTVYVNINAGLVSLGNDTTLCYGNPLVLDAGTLATKYLWSTGDTTRTISVKEPGTYSVSVSKNTCQGADTLVVATVFPLVPAIGSDITSQCLPVAVRFTDNTLTVCGTAPVTGWAWDFGDGSISTDPAPVHSYRKAGTFTVKLTVTDSLGVNATITKDIKIVTIGPVSPTLDATSICLGKTVSLDAGNEGAQYTWTPAAFVSNDTVRSPNASPVVTTLFKVDITKCGVTIADSVMVYVDSVALPIIESDGKTLTAQPGITYAWYKDGVAIPGAANRTYKPVVGAYYQVEISNAKGCYGRSASYFFLPEGIAIPGSKMKVKVSPNPSTDNTIRVLFSKTPGQNVEVNMYDAFGRKVYSGNCRSNVNSIDCSKFHKGQYFVEVLTNGQRVALPVELL